MSKFYNSQQDNQGKGLSLHSNIFDGKTIDQTSWSYKNLLGITPTKSEVRVHTANGYGSTNTMIRRFTTVVTNIGADITYADSATLGASFTINTFGTYAISHSGSFSTASALGISLNSTQLTTIINSIAAANRLALATSTALDFAINCSVTLKLAPGDVIRPHNQGGASGTDAGVTTFTITKVD